MPDVIWSSIWLMLKATFAPISGCEYFGSVYLETEMKTALTIAFLFLLQLRV